MSTISERTHTLYGLYCLCHSDRGIRYIGITSRDPEIRLSAHRTLSRRDPHKTKTPVHRWGQKHGAGNVQMKILDQSFSSRKDLILAEIAWIDSLRTRTVHGAGGLNITPGGEGTLGNTSWAGRKHSNETKEKLSKRMKSVWSEGIPDEWLQNIEDGKARTRLERGDEINAKISKSLLGNKLSALLDMHQVNEIITKVAGGMKQSDVAREYGVHQVTISDIWVGRQWKDADRSIINALPKRTRATSPSKNDAVLAISMIHDGISQASIARQLGFSDSAISRIKRSETWKELPRPWLSA